MKPSRRASLAALGATAALGAVAPSAGAFDPQPDPPGRTCHALRANPAVFVRMFGIESTARGAQGVCASTLAQRGGDVTPV
jgi:hypothetical protein